ncbi:MAG: ACP S-malonyltransferase [Bacteroidota bacterium]|nr:ACP S-malonyltransferase [Bacteroidota bacterium]
MKAVVFPGQGSQNVGMASERYHAEPAVKKIIDQADEILGFSLSNIMFEGPEESLKQTEFTQPALYVHSMAVFQTSEISPDCVAGHSLGEFSALTAAGVLSFEDGLKLVRLRGQLMQAAGELSNGGMGAIIGLEDKVVAQICDNISEESNEIVVPANYNSSGQIVISGHSNAVNLALNASKEIGAKMAIPLAVSGAFHSPLMQSAYDEFKLSLEKVSFVDAEVPVYSNVNATPSKSADELKNNVLHQLLEPVLWTQTIEQMVSNGVKEVVELGPGKVLQGLIKRIDRSLQLSGIQ